MKHIFNKMIVFIALLLCFTSCTSEKFNPYRHATCIMTTHSQSQFELDKQYIVSHTSETLQAQLVAQLEGTVYDKYYSISEQNVYIEEELDLVKLIIEYQCTSSQGNYLSVAYFEYRDYVLTRFEAYKIEPTYAEL